MSTSECHISRKPLKTWSVPRGKGPGWYGGLNRQKNGTTHKKAYLQNPVQQDTVLPVQPHLPWHPTPSIHSILYTVSLPLYSPDHSTLTHLLYTMLHPYPSSPCPLFLPYAVLTPLNSSTHFQMSLIQNSTSLWIMQVSLPPVLACAQRRGNSRKQVWKSICTRNSWKSCLCLSWRRENEGKTSHDSLPSNIWRPATYKKMTDFGC